MPTWRSLAGQLHVRDVRAAVSCAWHAGTKVTIVGFGSLLSKRSALLTTPSIQASGAQRTDRLTEFCKSECAFDAPMHLPRLAALIAASHG